MVDLLQRTSVCLVNECDLTQLRSTKGGRERAICLNKPKFVYSEIERITRGVIQQNILILLFNYHSLRMMYSREEKPIF